MKLNDPDDAIRPQHLFDVISDCMRPTPGGGFALSPRQKKGDEPWLGDAVGTGGRSGLEATRATIRRMKERSENYDRSPANLKPHEIERLQTKLDALGDLERRIPELAEAAEREGVSSYIPALYAPHQTTNAPPAVGPAGR